MNKYERSEFRDYSNVTICNESVSEIKRLVDSKSKDGSFPSYTYQYEILTHLLREIYDMKQLVDRLSQMNKNLAQERDDLRSELLNLKRGIE